MFEKEGKSRETGKDITKALGEIQLIPSTREAATAELPSSALQRQLSLPWHTVLPLPSTVNTVPALCVGKQRTESLLTVLNPLI